MKRILALLLGTALLHMPICAQAGIASAGAAQEPVSQVVPLYLSSMRPMAMLTLGDAPPAPVIFDTGTDENLLTETYAKWLKLKVVGSSAMVDGTSGKSRTVPLVELPEPRLSGALIAPPTAQVYSSDEQDTVGIVGPQSFAGRLLTLELGLDRFRLSPLDPGTLPQSAATPYINGVAASPIAVAGIPLTAVLDSGATADLMLSRSLMGKVPLKEPARITGKAESVSGIQDVYGGQIDGDVVIGPLRLKDPQVRFINLIEDAVVGYKVLQQLTVVIDPAGKRSWVLDPSFGMAPLAAYAGRYGDRTLRAEGSKLVYQRDGRPAAVLKTMGSGLFENPETGDRIQFRMDRGKAVGLDLFTPAGQVASASRSD